MLIYGVHCSSIHALRALASLALPYLALPCRAARERFLLHVTPRPLRDTQAHCSDRPLWWRPTPLVHEILSYYKAAISRLPRLTLVDMPQHSLFSNSRTKLDRSIKKSLISLNFSFFEILLSANEIFQIIL